MILILCPSGFEKRERTYRNFPEALLHWKVALEIVSGIQVHVSSETIVIAFV